MSLTLYYHPLSSYCHKVLVALYENETSFKPQLVNLQDVDERAALIRLWPVGKFPLLHDDFRGLTLPESSIIIEHVDRHYPGRSPLIPTDADAALQVRLWDRFYDLHVHTHMQVIVGDRLRPADQKDPHGVANARTRMETAYGSNAKWRSEGGPRVTPSAWRTARPRPRCSTLRRSLHSRTRIRVWRTISRGCQRGRPMRAC